MKDPLTSRRHVLRGLLLLALSAAALTQPSLDHRHSLAFAESDGGSSGGTSGSSGSGGTSGNSGTSGAGGDKDSNHEDHSDNDSDNDGDSDGESGGGSDNGGSDGTGGSTSSSTAAQREGGFGGPVDKEPRDGLLAHILRGKIADVREIETVAKHVVPGDVVNVALTKQGKNYVYEVRMIYPDGDIIDLTINAVTRSVMSVGTR